MNKKNIILAVLAFLVLSVMVVFLLTRPLSLSLEQLFPSQALIYGRLSHVKGDLQKLVQTTFWKNVSTMDLPLIMEHNKALARDVQELRMALKELDAILKNPLTEKFLGKEIAIGLYQQPSGQYEGLFATRLGVSMQMAELLVSMANQWSDDVSTTNENYQGFKIVHVHFNKKKFDMAYVRIKDVLFISTPSSKLLYQAIETFRKKKVPLSQDVDYSRAVSRAYSKGHGIFYINIQKLSSLVHKHLPDAQKSNFHQLSEGFQSYLVSFIPGDISKLKLIMNFDSQKVGSYWKGLLKCTPTANASLKFIPYNALAYQWGQCYNFKDLFAKIPSSQTWQERIEQKFNLDLNKELFPVLGAQLGGYLNDVDTQSLYPYPRGILFVKVDNRQATEDLLKKLTANPITAILQEEYNKSNIYYITLPFGANMDPSYVFLGDYLLLGSSRQLLKTSIDAFHNSNQSLESDEVLKKFNLASSSHGMMFIKMELISKKLQALLDWYNKMVSSQIGMALTYQQEVGGQRKELAEAVASKKEEITLAKNKLKDLIQSIGSPELPTPEQVEKQASIDHLAGQLKFLEEELQTYYQQQQQLQENLINYKSQSEYAKVWLFNSDEIFMPLLKGLEGFHTLGMSMHLTDQLSETEILIQ